MQQAAWMMQTIPMKNPEPKNLTNGMIAGDILLVDISLEMSSSDAMISGLN